MPILSLSRILYDPARGDDWEALSAHCEKRYAVIPPPNVFDQSDQ